MALVTQIHFLRQCRHLLLEINARGVVLRTNASADDRTTIAWWGDTPPSEKALEEAISSLKALEHLVQQGIEHLQEQLARVIAFNGLRTPEKKTEA